MITDEQPTYLDMPGRIVVIGDVHGDIKRFMQCLYNAGVFSKDLKWIAQPSDTVVVQLGDQIDSLTRSNTTPWEELPDVEMITLTEKLDAIAKIGGGRLLSIIGNHEVMNIMHDFTYVSQVSKDKYNLQLRAANFRLKDGMFTKILAKRNLVLKIGPYLFCHGGLLPHHLDAAENNLYLINQTFRKHLMGRDMSHNEKELLVTTLSEQGIIWTRAYSSDYEDLETIINEVLQRTSTQAIFVGHCTVPNVTLVKNKVILTDTGLSRSFGTQKFQYIDIKGNNIQTHEIA